MESKEAKIIVENGTEVTLVTFEDENILEEPQIRRLERALLPIVRENEQKRLVLNFQNVRFMSSSFLGLLTAEEREFFAQQTALGPLTYGPRSARPAAAPGPLGQRIDVKG